MNRNKYLRRLQILNKITKEKRILSIYKVLLNMNTRQKYERVKKHRQISLPNTHAKIFFKIFTKSNLVTFEKDIMHDKIGFILQLKSCLNSKRKYQERNRLY